VAFGVSGVVVCRVPTAARRLGFLHRLRGPHGSGAIDSALDDRCRGGRLSTLIYENAPAGGPETAGAAARVRARRCHPPAGSVSTWRKRRAYHRSTSKSVPLVRIGLHPLSRRVFDSWRSAATVSGVSTGGVGPRHSTRDVASVRSTPSASMVTAAKHDPRPVRRQRTWQSAPPGAAAARVALSALPPPDALRGFATGFARSLADGLPGCGATAGGRTADSTEGGAGPERGVGFAGGAVARFGERFAGAAAGRPACAPWRFGERFAGPAAGPPACAPSRFGERFAGAAAGPAACARSRLGERSGADTGRADARAASCNGERFAGAAAGPPARAPSSRGEPFGRRAAGPAVGGRAWPVGAARGERAPPRSGAVRSRVPALRLAGPPGARFASGGTAPARRRRSTSASTLTVVEPGSRRITSAVAMTMAYAATVSSSQTRPPTPAP
jgi:hypothetical protein